MYMKLLVKAKFGGKQFKKTLTANQNMRTRPGRGLKEFPFFNQHRKWG